jgi:anaerobic dimethyl sulfoxide reductase subunit A
MAGGVSEIWSAASYEGAVFAAMATFGTVVTGNTRDDILNSNLIVMWGFNPAETWQNTNTPWYLTQAKEAGIKIVSVDPRFTNTAALYAGQWIPIRPGTDAAMLISLAYVIIKEGLQDQKFLDAHTIGFDRYRDYVLGADNGVPKTPKWAEAITGVSAATIENLAKDYARIKPACLLAGCAPGRTAYGEQYHRASTTLAALTGNIGIHGGETGLNGWWSSSGFPFMKLGQGMPLPPNPVEEGATIRKNAFSSYGSFKIQRGGRVHTAEIADAILEGKAGGFPADYKLFYIVNTNLPNQYLNINKCVEALQSERLEFIVSFEQFLTSSAKFADIVLPVNTCFERNDITVGPTTASFYGFMGKAVDSIGESKSHLEICTALAEKLGITGYSDKNEDEWLREIAAGSPYITDYEAFKKAGGLKLQFEKPYIAFKPQIEDPINNPFPTPSGKIEIYCQRLADMNDPLIPPIPKYIETWENIDDPLAEKYPLQLVTTHIWRRALSQYDNIPWLRELEPQSVMMNMADAEARRLKNGETVKVFNERGATILPVRVTNRIMPGVVDIPHGAWYNPDENGVDRAGSVNVLTRDKASPGGSFPSNTSLVQVEKA